MTTKPHAHCYEAVLGKNGRFVVPMELRTLLDLHAGDRLLLIAEAEALRVTTIRAARQSAKARMRKYRRKGRSVVDDFLSQRRKDAARE